MVYPIRMADLGTTVDEIKIVAWRVKEGDTVKRGDIIAEIETDKAAGELECAVEGVLLKLLAPAGATVQTGEILAYVGRPGEPVPEAGTETAGRKAGAAQRATVLPFPGLLHVSPIVRNLAEKLGVDLLTVRGTGKGGVVTREDVLRANTIRATEGVTPGAEALSRSQSAVAKAVLRSIREIPHLRLAASVDMTATERARIQSAMAGARISYDAVFLKAMAGGIDAVPLVAARLDGDRVIRPEGIHIALAIGVENELFLPVLRDVGQKDLSALQSEIEDLYLRAKAGALKPEQLTGGCMALSNLGMYPIEFFDGIIFPEHSAILAVGAVQKRPVAVDDRVEIRPTVTVTLAVDHRLINGRTAAQFLNQLKGTLESGTLF